MVVKLPRLNRDKDHKKALFRNLISALVLYGHIHTTKAKAKALRPLADRLIIKARKAGRQTKDELVNFLTSRAAFTKLFAEILPRLQGRKSGFTRIVVLGPRRGDSAAMVNIEWVKEEERPETKNQKE